MSNLYSYNTSSAYKLDYTYGAKRHNENKRPHEENKKTEQRNRNHSFLNITNFIRVALCFAIAFVIVNGYVRINEAYSSVAKLEKQYNEIVATNQDLQVKIDKAVDLEQLLTIANEKFGMISPERYQMFYVDLSQSDFAQVCNEEKKIESEVAMSGVTGTITGAMNIFK
ncbi:MAG: septum formation initiator family protein [Clostridia bacterium]|nr:septum formation initiator family protein [Clostridia bacterium]